MRKSVILIIAVVEISLLPAAYTQAAGPRPAATVANTNPAATAAGTYTVDARHASVIARIQHLGGVSWTAFRFDGVSGSLDWNPAAPEQAKLTATIDMKSLTSPVAGFAAQLTGDSVLKTTQFPQASFASTGITATSATTGRIDGNLTFMGVTKAASIDASFVGSGRAMSGAPIIGFTGEMRIKRSDFGLTALSAAAGDEVRMAFDIELTKQP